MFSRKIIKTEDGSATLFIPEWNESYHSKHGAIQEAYHVFIRNGLDLMKTDSPISILEIGFGTGLNALITLLESHKRNLKIKYTGIEKFPVSKEEFALLDYPYSLHGIEGNDQFQLEFIQSNYSILMESNWEEMNAISPQFQLKKIQADFMEFDYTKENFDLIYFDAFGARVQPELWTEELFQKMIPSLKTNGIFTTYSAKGSVRRALIAAGLTVEKRPGPPGKREMLVGQKLDRNDAV